MTETPKYNTQNYPIDPERGGRHNPTHTHGLRTIADLLRRLVVYNATKRTHNPPTPYIPSNN